jgi:hypothetical protein
VLAGPRDANPVIGCHKPIVWSDSVSPGRLP